jgi:predicted RNA-binding protein with PUA-like domain
MPYLLKTEPAVYSFDDLQRDKETTWDGVTNPQANNFLAAMKKGDKLIIYHTGGVRVAFGTATVTSVDAGNPRVPVVRIQAGKPLKNPKSLDDMKKEKLFTASPLLRQGRLSVVPLTDEQYGWLTQ